MNYTRLLAASASVGGELYGKLRQERARAEAAEAALREAEKALEGIVRVSIGWEATEVAEAALKRIRTTIEDSG